MCLKCSCVLDVCIITVVLSWGYYCVCFVLVVVFNLFEQSGYKKNIFLSKTSLSIKTCTCRYSTQRVIQITVF